MNEAYIVEAVRSPVGKRGGILSDMHPVDLAAEVLAKLVERSGLDASTLDDVILGCIEAVGPQSADIARTAALAAGFPEHVPGVTIDRRCGSSQQAVQFAATAVMAGIADLIIAGGVQHMSSIPLGASYEAGKTYGFEDPLGDSTLWRRRYDHGLFSQLQSADLLANRWGFTRSELEAYSMRSHERALAAQAEGLFEREIVTINGKRIDEGPRQPDPEKISTLPPVQPGGKNTAATSSQISDGAAALLIASEDACSRFGLEPRARIHHLGVIGDDPELMLTAPIAATRRALKETGMELEEIDVIEINEAFASVVLAWEAELGPDMSRVNPNGGAIALGHPIGATGARLMVSMLYELDRQKGRFGLQTMCEGGGQANVTIIERL